MPEDPKRWEEKSKRRNRLSIHQENNSVLAQLPDLGEYEYLKNVLEDLGTTMSGANGPEVLSYSEIESFVNLTGIELTPQEVYAVRKASGGYVEWLHRGEDPKAMSPWRPDNVSADQHASFEEGLLRVLQSHANKPD